MRRLLGFLCDGQPATLADALDADGAGPVRTRQDDRGRTRPVAVGQGAEAEVDRDVWALLRSEVAHLQPPVHRSERLARRDQINVVRAHRRDIGYLDNRHARSTAQKLRQASFILSRSAVEHDDEGHAGLGRHRPEKRLQPRDASGRAGEADNRQGVVIRFRFKWRTREPGSHRRRTKRRRGRLLGHASAGYDRGGEGTSTQVSYPFAIGAGEASMASSSVP